jgi:hypothetical protein
VAIAWNCLENTALKVGLSLRGDVLSNQFGNLIVDMSRKFGEKAVVIKMA